MKSNFRLAFEGLDGVNVRLDKTDGRLGNIEARLERVEVGQVAIKADLSENNRRLEGLECCGPSSVLSTATSLPSRSARLIFLSPPSVKYIFPFCKSKATPSGTTTPEINSSRQVPLAFTLSIV
jgi:hypothetical protein